MTKTKFIGINTCQDYAFYVVIKFHHNDYISQAKTHASTSPHISSVISQVG